MISRTRVRAVGALLALGTAVGGGALASHDAAVEAALAVPPPGYVFYDDYWSHEDCTAEGASGQLQGNWRAYHCEESAIDWNLWVLY